jgi:hypothetical protein
VAEIVVGDVTALIEKISLAFEGDGIAAEHGCGPLGVFRRVAWRRGETDGVGRDFRGHPHPFESVVRVDPDGGNGAKPGGGGAVAPNLDFVDVGKFWRITGGEIAERVAWIPERRIFEDFHFRQARIAAKRDFRHCCIWPSNSSKFTFAPSPPTQTQNRSLSISAPGSGMFGKSTFPFYGKHTRRRSFGTPSLAVNRRGHLMVEETA